MLLIGTPGDYPDGLFYAASEGLLPNWTRRRWTLQDNPFLDAHAKDPKVIQDEEGLSSDDALYIREYLGEYALNVKTQMFEFDPRKNTFLHDGKVPEGYQVYLGVDFGWVDESAIVAVAWSEMTKKMYVLESWAASQQDSDMMAARILDFKNRYAPRRILGDVGGYGKGMSGPIFNNYGLYIEPAQKLDKLNHLQFVNSAFARGELMINAADPIVQELPKVLWNDKRSDAHNKAKDNRSMAMVYAVYPALQQHGKLAEVKSLSELVGGGWPEDELRAKLGASVPGEHQTATDWFLNNF